jgi:hypothetical protein
MSHQETMSSPTLDGPVRAWLRIEGLAALVAGAIIFARLGGDWLWFVPAMLAVDISAIGYVRGPRAGAIVYNAAHNWATALVVLGSGLVADLPVLAMVGGVLVAHVGMDRAAGYGLKLRTSFGDTHLGRIGKRRMPTTATSTTTNTVPVLG